MERTYTCTLVRRVLLSSKLTFRNSHAKTSPHTPCPMLKSTLIVPTFATNKTFHYYYVYQRYCCSPDREPSYWPLPRYIQWFSGGARTILSAMAPGMCTVRVGRVPRSTTRSTWNNDYASRVVCCHSLHSNKQLNPTERGD